MKKVFDNFDQLKIEAESEEETEKEVPERPPPPAIPKRNFEVEPKENDSGVSSGGENPTDVLQEIFSRFLQHFEYEVIWNLFSFHAKNPLQPVQTNPRPIYQRQPSNKNGSSVIDIFDVSRSDDPFDVAQLNSLDEKEILAQVFLPPNNNNTPESTGNSISDPLWVKKLIQETKKSKPPKPPQPSVASSLQNVLAQRQVQRQIEKNQNFNKVPY